MLMFTDESVIPRLKSCDAKTSEQLVNVNSYPPKSHTNSLRKLQVSPVPVLPKIPDERRQPGRRLGHDSPHEPSRQQVLAGQRAPISQVHLVVVGAPGQLVRRILERAVLLVEADDAAQTDLAHLGQVALLDLGQLGLEDLGELGAHGRRDGVDDRKLPVLLVFRAVRGFGWVGFVGMEVDCGDGKARKFRKMIIEVG